MKVLKWVTPAVMSGYLVLSGVVMYDIATLALPQPVSAMIRAMQGYSLVMTGSIQIYAVVTIVKWFLSDKSLEDLQDEIDYTRGRLAGLKKALNEKAK